MIPCYNAHFISKMEFFMSRTLLFILALFGCIACTAQSKETTPASLAGNNILKTGNYMAMTSREVVRGSCWDYINTVYNRAGYPQSKRHYVLKGKKNRGPYAKANMIQKGDWLYYINHSYNNVEHSGIFVKWVNKRKRIAKILSYGGQSRKKPGRYRNYDLSHVYTIIRPKG